MKFWFNYFLILTLISFAFGTGGAILFLVFTAAPAFILWLLLFAGDGGKNYMLDEILNK